MRRTDQVSALLLLALGAGFAAVARARHPYWGANGPGSGFLPFWLGVTLAALALLLLAGATRSRQAGGRWLPRGRGLARFLTVVLATAAFVALMNVLGMALGTALFLLVVLRFVERYRWRLTLPVAVGVAALNWLVFTFWLAVPFPVGVLGF